MLIEQPSATRRHSIPRWAWITGLAVGGLIAAAAIFLGTHSPFSRSEITRALQEATGRDVEIRTFRKTWAPPGCTAGGIRVIDRKAHGLPPLIEIQELSIRGSYLDLLRSTKHIPEVVVRGMHLKIPRSGSGVPLFGGGSGKPLVLDRIVADGALLEFLPNEPKSIPYRIEVRRLTLTDVGSGAPWKYRLVLFNAEPPGEIRAEGRFGPWKNGDAGATQVSGTYEYRDAKLGVFEGIEGTLTGKGEFHGPLARIETHGTTSVPDFHVAGSGHRIELRTEFRAAVDATSGAVRLEPVEARFLRSMVTARGNIDREADLDLSVPHGRLEDLLLLFVRTPKAPMTGKVDLRLRARIPGGNRPFLRKLALDGDFGVDSSRFTSSQTQKGIDRLSKSAQGESKEEEAEDPSTVLSDLKGHVSVKNGIARFSSVSFSFTGAHATLAGTWGLIDHQFDIRGTLQTRGHLSETTSGFKALVVKALTPFLKKHESVKLVPFRIRGTSSDPVLALDWGRALSHKD